MTGEDHPYVGAWWRAGHVIGYEYTFVHTFADFVKAVVAGQSVYPTFADGLATERQLSAIPESARSRQWVTLRNKAPAEPCRRFMACFRKVNL